MANIIDKIKLRTANTEYLLRGDDHEKVLQLEELVQNLNNKIAVLEHRIEILENYNENDPHGDNSSF